MRTFSFLCLFLWMLSACGSYRSADNYSNENNSIALDSVCKYDSCISVSADSTNIKNIEDLSVKIIELSLKDSFLYPSKVIDISKKSSSDLNSKNQKSAIQTSSIKQTSALVNSNITQNKTTYEKKNNSVFLSLKTISIIIFSFCIFILVKKYTTPP